jgi:hypothetical protein
MKVTIELHNEEDALDALNGTKWKLAMFELDQELRGIVKHGYIGNREATDCEMEVYDKCRELLREKMNDYNLIFD